MPNKGFSISPKNVAAADAAAYAPLVVLPLFVLVSFLFLIFFFYLLCRKHLFLQTFPPHLIPTSLCPPD